MSIPSLYLLYLYLLSSYLFYLYHKYLFDVLYVLYLLYLLGLIDSICHIYQIYHVLFLDPYPYPCLYLHPSISASVIETFLLSLAKNSAKKYFERNRGLATSAAGVRLLGFQLHQMTFPLSNHLRPRWQKWDTEICRICRAESDAGWFRKAKKSKKLEIQMVGNNLMVGISKFDGRILKSIALFFGLEMLMLDQVEHSESFRLWNCRIKNHPSKNSQRQDERKGEQTSLKTNMSPTKGTHFKRKVFQAPFFRGRM